MKQHLAPVMTIYTSGLDRSRRPRVSNLSRASSLCVRNSAGGKSIVPLADSAIGSLQPWRVGTWHGVGKRQLQIYLDEFVFGHNRRRQPMAASQRLLGLGAMLSPAPYRR